MNGGARIGQLVEGAVYEVTKILDKKTLPKQKLFSEIRKNTKGSFYKT